jgi:hypothetical protein
MVCQPATTVSSFEILTLHLQLLFRDYCGLNEPREPEKEEDCENKTDDKKGFPDGPPQDSKPLFHPTVPIWTSSIVPGGMTTLMCGFAVVMSAGL